MNPDIGIRLRDALERDELDAVLLTSQENITYVAGYTIPSLALRLRHRRFAAVVRRDGSATLVVSANELSEAREKSLITQIVAYDEFEREGDAVIAEVLEEMGVTSGRVGLEFDSCPAGLLDHLRTHSGALSVVDCTGTLASARMVKTASEIARLEAAARAAVQSQVRLRGELEVGMSERAAYSRICAHALNLGADDVLMVQVAAGDRSLYSNPTPGPTTFTSGVPVKVDVFVGVGGYLSDTGRSFVLDRVDPGHLRLWDQMSEVMGEIAGLLRPGRLASEIWDFFVAECRRRRIEPTMNFLGHGLGLSLHEEPFIRAGSDTLLEEGMVLAVEPVCTDGEYGFHMEDIFEVTTGPPKLLTDDYGAGALLVESVGRSA